MSSVRTSGVRILDPRSEVSLLIANCFQYQSSQSKQQAALLALVHSVIDQCRAALRVDVPPPRPKHEIIPKPPSPSPRLSPAGQTEMPVCL